MDMNCVNPLISAQIAGSLLSRQTSDILRGAGALLDKGRQASTLEESRSFSPAHLSRAGKQLTQQHHDRENTVSVADHLTTKGFALITFQLSTLAGPSLSNILVVNAHQPLTLSQGGQSQQSIHQEM